MKRIKKAPASSQLAGLFLNHPSFERTYNETDFNKISITRQVGGNVMTIRTRRTDEKYIHTNGKDWTGDIKKRSTAQEMPDLPAPFVQDGDCHWQLWSDDIIATLWYDRQCAQWNVRFDWPDIPEMKFDRAAPATDMLQAIIEAIDNRWQEDDNDWVPF